MALFLTRSKLQSLLDPDRIVAAIRAAESECTAEIRVSVSGAWWGDPEQRAQKAFLRLGMTNTEHRNGVLIFLMPHRRRFAVLGDQGIHAAVGHAFWEAVTAAMSQRFQADHLTEGLEHGIAEIGRQLTRHFPAVRNENPDELPDQVDFQR